MTADRAFFQHHALQLAAVFQQFTGADVARQQHRVFRHRRAGLVALTGQDAQQAVRQIVKVVQPLAHEGVGHLVEARAGGGLLFLHRRLGRQAALDVFLHPLQPAAGIGEHAVGFQHLLLFAVAGIGLGQQRVDRQPQFIHCGAQAQALGLGVVGNRVGHHHARLVQPNATLGRALLPGGAAEHHRMGMQRAERLALADKGTKLGHFGDHHRHDFERVNLILGVLPGGLRLHHHHAQLFA